MSYEITRGSVDPYPLRASSFAEIPDVFESGEILNLNEAERTELLNFEKNLYEELKEIKDIKINTHEIYPAAFTSGKGRVMIEIIYKDGAELKSWLEAEAKKANLDLKDKDTLKSAYQAVFHDIFNDSIPQNGMEVVFTKLGELIKKQTGKEATLVRDFKFDNKEETETDIEKLFADLNLKSIPLRWREKIHNYSENWAREKFKSEFLEHHGSVEEIKNQKRICRLTDPEKNDERLKRLRDLKDKITFQAKELGESVDELNQGKVIVLDIYRKYINTQIADDMLLRMGAGVNGKEILSLDSTNIERYDRFIHGVGEAYDSRGNRALLTDKIDRLVEEIKNSSVEAPQIEIDITNDDVVRIANWIIAEYGFSKWTAVKRRSELGSIGILVNKSKINIPKEPNKNLPALLSVLAHEIEGHVLSHQNWDSVKIPLKIMRFYSAGGRDEILAEAAGKKIEKETRKAIDGFEDRPVTAYYHGMQLKLKGGTFKDCFQLFFDLKLKNSGSALEDVFGDEEKYNSIFNHVYDNAMRLFREHTPLDDTSGRLTTTDQLKYLEQETVVEALRKHGLDAVLYVNGPDLYSIMDLIKLGVFELDKIQKPKMIVAEKVWPILKKGLEEGKIIKEILDDAGIN